MPLTQVLPNAIYSASLVDMSRIPQTQKKLREARFFLRAMSLAGRSTQLDNEAFEFYLSAFLSAARSVTWVLQSEQKESYDSWFPAWAEALREEERALFKFMNDQRVAEVHQQGTETYGDIEMVPLTRFDWGPQGHPAYGAQWFGPPGIPPPEMGVRVYYFKASGDKENALESCRRYLEVLDKLVREFEAAFPTAMTAAP